MRRIFQNLAFLSSIFLVSTGTCWAQYPPPARPTVSPYLNLARPGSNPALNYYNLVRPQIDFRNSIQQLQQQYTVQNQAVTGLELSATMPTTGHPSRFMNTSGWFLRLSGTTPLTTAPTAVANRPTQTTPPPRR